MRISILQENLAKGVGAVSRMIASKTQLPILSNILLTIDKGRLKLGATNLETGMNLWIGAKVEKPGKITVPARVLSELVSSLPQETARLTAEEDKLKVKCGTFRSVINGIGAEEFPVIPTLASEKKKGGGVLKMSGEALNTAVKQVAFAAGIDEARPIFTGVKMEMGKGRVRLAATDGYRLSVKEIGGVKGLKKAKDMVVPARALMEMVKVYQEEKQDEVGLLATDEEKQLILSLNSAEIVTRLLEGDFPDFDKIIPSGSSTKMELEAEELQQAVRAAAIFARDSANIVRFKTKGSKLIISANAPQVGENQVTLSIKKTGGEVEVAFNSRYLLEMLSVVETERLSLGVSGALSPGVFKIPNDDSFVHIIMPVRVQS